jgi:hypothetical protein
MSEQIVEVVFINEETGDPIAGGNIPTSQLPDTFAKNTVMHINEQPWQVIKADPVTAEEFTKTGKLTLTCAKIEYVSDKGVLYSLPTINDETPETGDLAPEQNVFTLHEDDWRQVEFISESHLESANTELRAIMSIYQNHQEEAGFSKLHIRKAIKRPLNTTLTIDKIKQYLPSDVKDASAVVFAQDENRIDDVFALNISPLVIYGHVNKSGNIDALCMQFIDNPTNTLPYVIDGLVNFMKDHDLIFVDWVRLQIIPPMTEGFQTYFSKFNE